MRGRGYVAPNVGRFGRHGVYKVPAIIIGFDSAAFEDAMGSGVPLGVLRAELGDVSVLQMHNVRGKG